MGKGPRANVWRAVPLRLQRKCVRRDTSLPIIFRSLCIIVSHAWRLSDAIGRLFEAVTEFRSANSTQSRTAQFQLLARRPRQNCKKARRGGGDVSSTIIRQRGAKTHPTELDE